MLERLKSMRHRNSDRPLLPNLIRLKWIAPWDIEDATYFMHARVESFHVCLPEFPDIYYCEALLAIPSRMPYLRCLRTFLLDEGTAELWEAELVSVQSQLPLLEYIHPCTTYEWREK
jgi:hypothetical protein